MGSEYTSVPMKDVRKYYTKEQINALIRSCKRPRDRLILYTLAVTGRRVSEIVRCLTPQDIDFEKGLVNYTILKRKRPTKLLLPAHPLLLKALRQYIKRQSIAPHQHIFPISRQRVHQIIKDAADQAGLEVAHTHMFRHSFAIQSAQKLKNPIDLAQLQSLLGHARIDTTMFYLRFNPTEQRELVKDLWK